MRQFILSSEMAMKKFAQLFKCSNRLLRCGNQWRDNQVFRCLAASYSNLTTPRITSTGRNLYKRLAQIGNPNPSASILPILDQWVEEGRPIHSKDLLNIVARFQKSRRPYHCLPILKWACDKKAVDPSPEDVSLQLELIFMVHGTEHAEMHFNCVPKTLRVPQVYASLLKCCAKAKDMEKAEVTMQKMRELVFASSWSYSVMLTLYHNLGDHKKFNLLVKEMKEKGVNHDSHMYNIRLKAYLAWSDVEKMEILLTEMEADTLDTMDWNIYASAANAYIKAGAPQKAFETLTKSERIVRGDKMFAHGVILTLYASMGKKEEVYRIWNLSKKEGKFFNKAYLLMLNSLVKLDDIDGAEKIFNKWEAKREHFDHRTVMLNSLAKLNAIFGSEKKLKERQTSMQDFDHRIPRTLVKAYCKKGLMEKAEVIVKRLIENGNEPRPHIWCLMAKGYLINNQVDKAVEALKKEICASSNPTQDLITSASCVEYLDRIDAGEEIVKSLHEKGMFSKNAYEKLRVRLVRNEKDPLQVVKWKGMVMTWS